MIKAIKISIIFLYTNFLYAQNAKDDSIFIRKLYVEAMTNGKGYKNLEQLCTKVGNRLTGSPQAEMAVELSVKFFKESNADTIYLQKVKVPHWVRGEKEMGRIILATEKDGKDESKNYYAVKPNEYFVNILALGGSIATPNDGLLANVVEVKSLVDWEKMDKKNIKGKIVFFNQPMDPTVINGFDAYGPAVKQRSSGAIMAAKYGAVGVVVRSVTHALDDNPHTGAMRYVDSIPKIPACAISTKDAELLSKLLREQPTLNFEFKMTCQTLPDVYSNNVIAQLNAKNKLDTIANKEFIVCGGHLDSWDVGQGAHDDGAGCIQTIEAMRILKAVGYRPKRNLRFVMFMNEENGLKGGEEYALQAKKNKEKHIVGIESDAGGFAPNGFSFEATDVQKEKLKQFWPLFTTYGLHEFSRSGGGADISPLKKEGTALFELMPESQRYFDYHHTNIDTFDKVNKRELEQGAFSLAAFIYLVSEYGL